MSRRSVQPRFSGPVALTLAFAAVLCSPVRGASGDLLWEQTAMKSQSCPEPGALGGRIFTYTTFGIRGRPYPLLRAYDLRTGKPEWEARGRLNFHGFRYRGNGFAAAGGRVYSVAARWTSRNAVSVTARNAATGALRWIRDLADPHLQYRVYVVAAEDHRVFLLGQRYADGAPGNDPVWSEAMLLALDGRTGETIWSDIFNIGGGPDQGHSIAVAQGRVVVAVEDWPPDPPAGAVPNTVIRTYEAATGRPMWEEARKNSSPTEIVINRDRVFTLQYSLGDYTVLAAHDLETGQKVWERRRRRVFAHSMTAARRMVAIYGLPLGGRPGTRMQVYSGETGEMLWTKDEEDTEGNSILADRGRLFTVGTSFDSFDGFYLNAYRFRSGRSRWSVRRDEPETEEFGCRAIMHRGVLVTTSTEFPGEIVRAFEP